MKLKLLLMVVIGGTTLLTSCRGEEIEPNQTSATTTPTPTSGTSNELCLQSVMNQTWATQESIDIINGTSSQQYAEVLLFSDSSVVRYKYENNVIYNTINNTAVQYGVAPSFTDTSTTCNTWVYTPSNEFTHYKLEENHGDSIKIYHYWYGNSSMNYSAWYLKHE